MYKICNSHVLSSVQKSILLFGGKIPGDNAFPCFDCRKFFVFYFPPKPPRKVRQSCRQIYRSQCSTWRRPEPCWPIKALPKGRDVSVSKTVVLTTCHSVHSAYKSAPAGFTYYQCKIQHNATFFKFQLSTLSQTQFTKLELSYSKNFNVLLQIIFYLKSGFIQQLKLGYVWQNMKRQKHLIMIKQEKTLTFV